MDSYSESLGKNMAALDQPYGAYFRLYGCKSSELPSEDSLKLPKLDLDGPV